MKRTVFSILVLVVCLASMQAQPVKSRGFIPPLFSLPEVTEEIRFTSSTPPQIQLPEYPATQLNAGLEGAVEAELYVTAEGEVVYCEISVSSGVNEFDHAVLESSMRVKFPSGFATVKGLPHDFRIAVPFYFLLASDPEQYWHSRLELARIKNEYETVMKKFEDYLMARTVVSDSKVKEIQREMEATVTMAKNVHRLLAEKKEHAILRLRGLIDASKSNSAPIADTQDASWRSQSIDPAHATVQTGGTAGGVINIRELSDNESERLAHELELKKAYM